MIPGHEVSGQVTELGLGSPPGRRCSTMRTCGRGRRCWCTGPPGRSVTWRYSWPGTPAPASSAPGGNGTATPCWRRGAERFAALDTERFEDVAGQVDVVLDAIGGDILDRPAAIVRPGGALVSIIGPLKSAPPGIRAVDDQSGHDAV